MVQSKVWHKDVDLYQVDDSKTGENIGYFFTDIYVRDGKHGGAFMVDLQRVTLFSLSIYIHFMT